MTSTVLRLLAHSVMVVVGLLYLTSARSADVGYSLVNIVGRSGVAQSARGPELIFNFGDSKTNDRYRGDRFSVAVGRMNGRDGGADDDWIKLGRHKGNHGETEYLEVKSYDPFYYVSFTHRWYTVDGRFPRAPQLRFFVATGLFWHDAVTCGRLYSEYPRKVCYDGSPELSSRWAFAQEIGIKWRRTAELAIRHSSTGRISEINLGENYLRFSLMGHFGDR